MTNSDCIRKPSQGRLQAYKKGCRCDECKATYSEWKRAWRARGGAGPEQEREAARRWKRTHLGQPGLPGRS